MNSWRQKASWHQRPTRVKHRQKAKPPGEDDPGAAPSSPKGSFMSRSRQQALYGERADPAPSARLPKLVRPRSEVAAQLGQRINMGKQILGSLPSSIMELSSSADDEKKWRDYNFDLLRAAFTSDAIAREYRGAPLAQARLIWDATSRPDAALNFTMLNTRRRSDRSNSRTQPRPPFFQRLSRPASRYSAHLLPGSGSSTALGSALCNRDPVPDRSAQPHAVRASVACRPRYSKLLLG
jgi:hypothetical protein